LSRITASVWQTPVATIFTNISSFPGGDLDVFDDERLLVAQRDGCFHLHGMTPE
jgi:hypothetical protein